MCFIYASLLEFVCVNYVGRKRPMHNVVYRPGENPVTQVLLLSDVRAMSIPRRHHVAYFYFPHLYVSYVFDLLSLSFLFLSLFFFVSRLSFWLSLFSVFLSFTFDLTETYERRFMPSSLKTRFLRFCYIILSMRFTPDICRFVTTTGLRSSNHSPLCPLFTFVRVVSLFRSIQSVLVPSSLGFRRFLFPRVWFRRIRSHPFLFRFLSRLRPYSLRLAVGFPRKRDNSVPTKDIKVSEMRNVTIRIREKVRINIVPIENKKAINEFCLLFGKR